MAGVDTPPIPLQQDTPTNVPGGGVRVVQVMIPVNGIMTPALVQVTAISSADGVILDDLPAYNVHLRILKELREIRILLAGAQGIAVLEDDLPPRSGM